MVNSKSSARSELEKLVRYFEANIHQLKASSFNEAQARQQLIDPFFEALGWDVRNKLMVPPYRVEVIPEGRVRSSLGKVVKDQAGLFDKSTALKEEQADYASMLEYIAEDEFKAEEKAATKKPDYRFRIQGSTKFFVEAKRPVADLINKLDPIFQVKRYGFSARVPVSILTDFEEFRVFDCTRKPFYDKPKVGVLKEFDLTYKSYLDDFDKLYSTFSREAVGAGSIEALQKKYLEKRTGEFALDRSFLEDLSQWRVELAQDIAKHPRNRRILNSYTLNECVQRILDRIVFLRVCEDRNIEVERTLVELIRLWQDHEGISLYEKLNELIKQRRSLYNGLLFAEHECEQLEVSNKMLEKIFKNINYPLSPYHFDEIGVEILGSIYERFLGKTIRLTQKQVRVEEKPEVRKAGGVYYTPQYIVEYIVDNTVGRLLYEERPHPGPLLREEGTLPPLTGEGEGGVRKPKLSPKQAAKLKIIDIACGSGSFLLGAFQKLIDYHIEWYTHHPEDIEEVNGVRDAYEDAQGRLVLSARKKREILVNNIFGVDIDQQAVEVTQMSLYLKVLENENDATLNKPTMLALHEVLLPPLKNNMKCGNSLIGTDFFAQGELFDDEARRKVNAFDWEVEFPDILKFPSQGQGKRGGFDCIIGNPPWVFGGGVDIEQFEKDYFQGHFESARGKVNLFALFIEKATKLVKRGGLVSYIVPNTLLRVTSYDRFRRYLLSNCQVSEIVDLGEGVFHAVTMSTIVITIKNSDPNKSNVSIKNGLNVEVSQTPQSFFIANDFVLNIFASTSDNVISRKLKADSIPLGELCKELIFGVVITKNIAEVVFEKKGKGLKPFVEGRDIGRYYTPSKTRYLLYEKKLLHRSRTPEVFEAPEKIMIQRITGGDRPLNATYDDSKLYNKESINNIILKQGAAYSAKYVLGLLNSKLLNWFYWITFTNASRLTVNLSKEYLSRLPIRTIEFTKAEEKKVHDDLVTLVDKMLHLHKHLHKASFDSEKEPIQRQIAATDKKIDNLVYELYGLTEEEIKIVEGK
jgi:hypothetical protein